MSTATCLGAFWGSPRCWVVMVVSAVVPIVGSAIGGAPLHPPIMWTGQERAMVLEDIHGLGLDGPVPLPHRSDIRTAAQRPDRDAPVIVLFASSSCQPCVHLVKRLGALPCDDGHACIVVYAPESGLQPETDAPPQLPPCCSVVRDTSWVLFRGYGVTSLPAAFVVRGDGRVDRAARGAERCWWLLRGLL